MEHPRQVRRRLIPDDAQVQILLGSLLGDARIEGAAGARCVRIAHSVARADYVWWKYERLVQFADGAPATVDDRIGFRTIAHPLFDDLAPLFAAHRGARSRVVRDLLAPLGLAVWMTDIGRLELRPELFLPKQREFALCA
jgi:hypothetical protein